MKKAILLLSLIVVSTSCLSWTDVDIDGNWTGMSSQNGNQKLDMSIIQKGDKFSGTWSYGAAPEYRYGLGIGGNVSGTIIAYLTFQATLSGPEGYSATIKGDVRSDAKRITGSGTDQYGQFVFQLIKI